MFAVTLAFAAPYLPNDDAQVLERVPMRVAPAVARLDALRAESAQAPNDPRALRRSPLR